MGTTLTIILSIVVIIIYKIGMKKIDDDERKAMKTPGVAEYIRNNFPSIVDCLTKADGYTKDFERNGYIRFVNSDCSQKVVLQQWSGKLNIAIERNGSLIKEWSIGIKDLNSLLISEIKKYISSYSYWDSYKEREPIKAEGILELTHLNMDKQSDKACREIVESLERWSHNTGKPISVLKKYFIDSAIKAFGTEGLTSLGDKLKSTEMQKEAASFGIDKDHTIARFMIEAIDEYIQSENTRKIEEHLKKTLGEDFNFNAISETMQELNIAPDISHLNNKENRWIELLEDCCNTLNDKFKPLNSLGKCEAMLFFSTQLMDYGEFKNEIDMDVFEDRFKLLLCDKLIEFDTNNIFVFLNTRVDFYKEEYSKLKNSSYYTPIALYNVFYVSPGIDLEIIRNQKVDMSELMHFNIQIINLVNHIHQIKDSI